MRCGIERKRIGCFYAHYFEMRQNQYFDLPYLLQKKDEVFVDCGAYHGETSEQFIKWCGKKYKHIYCFEPDRNNLEQCCKNLSDNMLDEKYTVINKGTWSEERVTFIKMDIEGTELELLKGAGRIIREQKPKLAICVYHKKEDIFDIPEYILNLNPKYKLYLRHYTLGEWDTVLYAIP